jgi:hypothetical protein
MKVFLLTNSSKDNTRIAGKGREGFQRLRGLRIDKLYLYLLTLGTGLHLVYQVMLASTSTLYPNVGDYKG